MAIEETYELAGITCQFLDFKSFSSFDNWRWKLDPYKAASTDSISMADIRIIGQEAGDPVTGKLLAEENVGFYAHRIYDAGNGHLRWNYEDSKNGSVMLSYDLCPAENCLTLVSDHTESGGTLAVEYLGRVLVPCFLNYNLLTLHGVLMEYCGQGLIISAPSGTGKTTHARLWRDHRNALILNGDRASVKKAEDTWYGYGLPWSGTSGEQINRKVPVKAIVVLDRGPENRAEVVNGMEAFAAVIPHVQAPVWKMDLAEKALDLTTALIHDIPVIRLTCRPDRESVDILEKVLNELPCQ